jgi:hypothetical protein
MKTNKNDDGNKTLTLEVRFFTDKIAPMSGEVLPKHIWDNGIVAANVGKNKRHDLRSMQPRPFNGLHDIQRAIRKVLQAHKIVLHMG